MNFQRGRNHEELEINFIPLIDVLLVIIIFLIVNATFSRTSELQINLPTAEANVSEEKPLIITVDVDEAGHFMVEAKDAGTSVESIANALKAAVDDGKDPTIVINADAKSTHQSVVNVMEAARLANFTHITFATQSGSSN
ncbi:MAG: biopolymer transporter ExbD [Methylophilaceae bacterium]|jgi:biopolymer transport protein ExbD|nr:biopolymer transporter ExbD [Methylophilaceae bacterium]MDG1445366.1 biopolymer transporter ExbD [Methylophilaceae bacterium]MDG1821518.1 biopolymer transporter ExbD [Methylophilaceae bacterium]MDG2292966.1 biopolymer transporter ExbD [Methylophilaceae bacterium]